MFDNSVTASTGGTGRTEWIARHNIETYAPVAFSRSGARGTTTWMAYNDIRAHGKINFSNTGAADTVIWTAYSNISTHDSVTFSNSGNAAPSRWIAYNDITTDGAPKGILFINDNSTSPTEWEAIHGSIWTKNPVTFDHSATLPISPGDDISWTAGRDIITDHTVTYDYVSPNKIEWWAKNGGIYINDSVNLTRITTGTVNNTTYLHAGDNTYHLGGPYSNCGNIATVTNDIVIESVFNYTETVGAGAGATVTLYAENDILTNQSCEQNSSHPTKGPAPVTFSAGADSHTSTLWEAERNINTKGRVDFLYDGAAEMGSLTWLSRAGYIQTERPLNIFYDSDSLISLRAENEFKDQASDLDVITHANVTGRRGNIHTFDTVNIVRNNSGNMGLTEILAENHIWTAMVNYEDLASSADTLNIISHYGDIYLGHNDGVNNNTYSCYVSPDLLANPSASCPWPLASPISYDLNRFTYKVNAGNRSGQLNILAGFDDDTDTGAPEQGGNIYFTHKDILLEQGSRHDTKIAIPFTNWYLCGDGSHGGHAYYEKAGIIGGVGRCAINSSQPDATHNHFCTDTGLIYRGYDGNLLVDAGTRGNIIVNNGAYLSFQSDVSGGSGNARFLTRWGDIDMRYPFNADSMKGGLLFLASSELYDKRQYICGCPEWRNNVYLQDFQYTAREQGGGSVYVGADNNIKLQYGGLRDIGTERDPFISENAGYPCGDKFHCDADTSINRARPLILNFSDDPLAGAIQSGGFAAVASDLIDVYRDLVYTGGQGTGMGSVPGYTTLHGESVAGYGLYIKTQGDKKNWTMTDFEINNDPSPTMGAACFDDACDNSYLHNTSRVTFHADARIHAEAQRALIASPVLETYGNLDLNTSRNAVNGRTGISIRTDSLIVHDSLIIDGPRTTLASWSRLYRGVPVVKLGHHRFTPPFAEATPSGASGDCSTCYTHSRDTESRGASMPLDTVYVTLRNDASLPRLHSLVADHAAVSFLTDSFDHVFGNPTLDAKIFTDTFKVRNHVEFVRKSVTNDVHDGHFELVSEPQMSSKDYAGIYTRHLHMEPIGPECSAFGYSQLWLLESTLHVITTSHFGGFGWLHNDVHVEIDATVAPGYASLEANGNCYEQHAGILRTKDLRIDKGGKLKFSIGNTPATGFTESYSCPNGNHYNLGEYADFLDVDSLTLRGRVYIDLVVRPGGLNLERGQKLCFPILRYQSIGEENLKHLMLSKTYLSPEDHPSIDGRYYLAFEFDEVCKVVSVCIVPVIDPIINRKVEIPNVAGVASTPPAGIHYVPSHTNFPFTLEFETPAPLAVRTGRIVDYEPEPELKGLRLNDNEYSYVIREVMEDITLQIGPEVSRTTGNAPIDETDIWSHNTTIYIKVEKENIASVFSIAGHLIRRIEVPAGTTTLPMPQGVYIVVLQDGLRHKVVVK
ncbi:MAG: T9SS type A sorting domain-containing protein [Tannerella sp.]|nr:T9SS type A sorting domain-containing protein [Tannerella sp.]